MNGSRRVATGTIGAVVFGLGSALAAQQVATVTLDEAIGLALRVQPAVVQAVGNVRIAQAGKREALGNWLPDLSGSGSISRNSNNRWNDATQSFVSSAVTGNSYSGGLTASIQLFDGFRRSAQGRAAGANLVSADADLVSAQFNVVLQTKQAFFNAVAAEQLVSVSETRIERADGQLRISRDKLAAGSATRSDTLRSTVELANARLQLLNAQTQLANAHASLARLIGFDGQLEVVADSAMFTISPLDTAGLRGEVLQMAPSITAAQAAVGAADAQVGVTRAQYFPSVSASYSPSWSRSPRLDGSGNAISPWSGSWSLRLSANWSIFNGFARESGVARSAAARDVAYARVDDERRLASAQLTQALAGLESAEARIGIARASLAAGEEDLRVQQERYRLGAATIVEVLTSQVSLDQAAVDLVQARLDYLVARAQLEALLGREL
ncbi:MAG TPA: TolC family protein [Gemmatimonadales bacterium]